MEYGRALNKVEDLRLIADYKNTSVESEKVAWAVDRAQEFVRAMRSAFMPESDNNPRFGR